jgi:hypothetical protein
MASFRALNRRLSGLPPRALLFFVAVILKLPLWLYSVSGMMNGPGLQALMMAFWLVWLAFLYLIAMPETDFFLQTRLPGFRWIAYGAALVAVLFTGIGVCALAAPATLARATGWAAPLQSQLNQPGPLGQYVDSTALVHQAAGNLLKGKNPYRSVNSVEAMEEFATGRPTPLRAGAFAESFPNPPSNLEEEVWERALTGPRNPPPEFDLRLAYPAGSFLVIAPFLLAGVTDIRLAYLVLTLAGLAVTVVLLPRRFRLVFAIGAIASMEMWLAVAYGETGPSFFAFLLPAWVLRNRRPWWSAALLGVAAAVKQQAWFLAPFFLIWIYRTAGPKRCLQSAGTAAGVFLVLNLPFLVQDPALWLRSVGAPMVAPLFPAGIGLVTLVVGGALDIRSPMVFGLLEGLVFMASLFWYSRTCRRYPQTAPVLAVLPLFFAWRSLTSYFMYADILVMAGLMMDGYTVPGTNLGPGEDAQPRARDRLSLPR